MRLPRSLLSVLVIATLALAAQASAASAAPQLQRFKAVGRIASGTVAKYDLKEESTAFEYRIRADRIQVGVFRRAAGRWSRMGVVKASPPRPLNFWRVFRRMGTGRYRLVARAVDGAGDDLEQSAPRTIRFRVVAHVPHDD
jgi:hypothetical protein